jgi:hypothetical protein
MNKLTIEHLAAYLPYGVKAEMLDYRRDYVGLKYDTIIGIHQWSKKGDWCVLTNGGSKPDLLHIKPILRSLSDLTTEIEHKGEKFVPMEELLKIKHKKWFDSHLDSRYSEITSEDVPAYAKAYFSFMATLEVRIFKGSIHNEEYWIVQKLLEWHFDIFGLREKNLCIYYDEIK